MTALHLGLSCTCTPMSAKKSMCRGERILPLLKGFKRIFTLTDYCWRHHFYVDKHLNPSGSIKGWKILDTAVYIMYCVEEIKEMGITVVSSPLKYFMAATGVCVAAVPLKKNDIST